MTYGNYAPFYRPTNYYNASIQNGQYPQQMPQMPQMPSMPIQAAPGTNDMLWVLNETEAVSFPVAVNNRVTLWDKNKDTVYIKSVDAQGVPSMRILDYVERGTEGTKTPTEHVCKCGDKFVPLETFNALVGRIDIMAAKLDGLTASKTKAKTKEEGENG